MKTVPFGPMTIVRPPGWPDEYNSTLNPGGSEILSSGMRSTGVAIGGVACGASVASCLLCAWFVRSIGLNPGGSCAAREAMAQIQRTEAMDEDRRREARVFIELETLTGISLQ